MKRTPLPSLDNSSSKPATTTKAPVNKPSLADAVPARSITLPGYHTYMIQVSQCGRVSIVTLMVNVLLFSPERLNEMVAEATRLTNECCLGNRRKSMASQKLPISDAAELNERWFPTDVEFFEAVMMDKFQFQRLNAMIATTEIEATVRIAA